MTYFYQFSICIKTDNTLTKLCPLLEYIKHTRLRIFFHFTKTYRTLSHPELFSNLELRETCWNMYRATYAGFNTSPDFCETILPLSSPSFIRASSFHSWDPLPRERFVIVYRIVYPIHGTLSPPFSLEGCAKGVEALGAPLSASKFMNRRLRFPRPGRSNPNPND